MARALSRSMLSEYPRVVENRNCAQLWGSERGPPS